MDYSLIFWRALHFLTTFQAAGVVLFCGLPALDLAAVNAVRSLKYVFWVSLALSFASGIGWFSAVAAAIDGSTPMAALSDGTAAAVISDTQFGWAWIVRFIAGALLAVLVAFSGCNGVWPTTAIFTATAILVGGLAFAGHAASSPGLTGFVHLAADILHLIAVSAWLGGLLPYVIVLGGRNDWAPKPSIESARKITRRFSDVGIVAVMTIAATGVINAANLVGGFRLLATTDYGRLLSIKVFIFLIMVVIAATNRFVLAPRLSTSDTIDAIRRNALIEAALGAAVLSIVAALGTMPPALLQPGEMPN